MKKKFCLAALGLMLLTACGQDKLVGMWVQPIAGQETKSQGILLRKDGSASSINMNTLLYETWKRNGDLLILTGKSVGNGQVINISEEYKIKHLDDVSLELQMGDFVAVYTRKNN